MKLLKSIVVDDVIQWNYKYDQYGKLIEIEGLYGYQRYLYDNDDKVIMNEKAYAPGWGELGGPDITTELMTAESSTISKYVIYKYDENSRLIGTENYLTEGDEFVSSRSYKYDNDKIVTIYHSNEVGELTAIYHYEYDTHGNVAYKTTSGYDYDKSGEPILLSESSYTYDTKINHFMAFKELSGPGPNTNSNNWVEINSINHRDLPPQILDNEKYTTHKVIYQYDSDDYPVRKLGEDGEDDGAEYRYY